LEAHPKFFPNGRNLKKFENAKAFRKYRLCQARPSEGFGEASLAKNKYLLTGVFFLTWMFFFDQKDILSLF